MDQTGPIAEGSAASGQARMTRRRGREIAALCREVAEIPTSGGHGADRVLTLLAASLEHRAARSESLWHELDRRALLPNSL
jgi:hypothetical protein